MVSSRSTDASSILYVALELGLKWWKVASTVGLGQRPRIRNLRGGDSEGLLREIGEAKKRFALPASARVVSLYEAGRDVYWLHRWLVSAGIENILVDSSSIEVSRRQRRAKTDRLDVEKLLSLLIRRELGSYCGLCPTPHSSGEETRERGITKAGNRRVRSIAVELAWGWLRFQPQSDLARWYERRIGRGGPRQRKIGIVALARKLVVALWRFVEQGVLPEGCELKADLYGGL